MKVTEHQIQAAYFAECAWRANQDYRWGLIYAIPNQGKRSFILGKRMQREGLKKGVPDVCVPVKTIKHGALYIEFKVPSKRQTEEQAEWFVKLMWAGNACVVCYSAASAIEATQNYIDGRLVLADALKNAAN